MLPFSASHQKEELVLEHIINRVRADDREIIVCTSLDKSNDPIIEICKKHEIGFFRGSEENKIKRWHDCFLENSLEWAHLLDADDPFFCNDEIEDSLTTYMVSGKAVLATAKSKSGNASVGITLGINHLKLLNRRVGNLKVFEMIEDLLEEELKFETSEIDSRDPIPHGTRLTLDYFEDYLALSVIKSKLGTTATRGELGSLISKNPWILELNQLKNLEWKERQARILQGQGGSDEQ